jgi:hypothetical protein
MVHDLLEIELALRLKPLAVDHGESRAAVYVDLFNFCFLKTSIVNNFKPIDMNDLSWWLWH